MVLQENGFQGKLCWGSRGLHEPPGGVKGQGPLLWWEGNAPKSCWIYRSLEAFWSFSWQLHIYQRSVPKSHWPFFLTPWQCKKVTSLAFFSLLSLVSLHDFPSSGQTGSVCSHTRFRWSAIHVICFVNVSISHFTANQSQCCLFLTLV